MYIRAFWEIKIYINIRFWLDFWFNFSTFSIFFLVGRCWCNPTTFLSTPVWLGEGEVPGPWDAVLTCRSDICRPWETSQSCQCLESTSLLKATYLETQLQCTRSWGRRAPNRRAWVWWTWWDCSCPPAWGWRAGYSTGCPHPAPRTEQSTHSRSRTPPETRGSEERETEAFNTWRETPLNSKGQGCKKCNKKLIIKNKMKINNRNWLK